MATIKRYLSSEAASYEPPTIESGWDRSEAVISSLSAAPSGAVVENDATVRSKVSGYKVLTGRFVSEPFLSDGRVGGALNVIANVHESSANMNALTRVGIYVTIGDTDDIRGGAVMAALAGGNEWPASSTAYKAVELSVDAGYITPVNALVGDRLVLEYGYQASSSSIAYRGYVSRGGTGSDAVPGGTSTDNPGWLSLDDCDDVFSLYVPTAPVADFTGTPLTGVGPTDVAFTDASSHAPTSWAWNFGDGGTSAAQNPTHTYVAAGTYTVTLVASNSLGSNTKTRTAYVAISPPVNPANFFAFF